MPRKQLRIEKSDYVSTDSFEFADSAVESVAASESLVTLGAGKQLGIVRIQDHSTIEHPRSVRDTAAGQYVYTVDRKEIRAYTPEGAELWRREIPGLSHVAVMDSQRMVWVTDANGDLIALNGETGEERLRVERPYADIEPTVFVGFDNRLLIAAWSFVVEVDPQGELTLDVDLHGAIETAGIQENQVIAATTDGRLIGVDRQSGNIVWEHDRVVSMIAPIAESGLLAVDDNGPFAIDQNGADTRIDVDASALVATSNGAVVCAVKEGTTSVFRRLETSAASVDAQVASDALHVGDPFAIEIKNKHDDCLLIRIKIRAEAAEFDESTRIVDLEPNGTEQIRFGVENVETVEKTLVTIELDEERLLEEQVSVRPMMKALEVGAELLAIEDGTAKIEAILENRGHRPIEHIVVDPGAHEISTLESDEQTTVDIKIPFDPGSTVTITAEPTGEIEPATTEITLPDIPLRVQLARTDDAESPFVDVNIENVARCPVGSETQINISDLVSAEKTFNLDSGCSQTFAVSLHQRPIEPFQAQARVSAYDIDERIEFEGWDDEDVRSIDAAVHSAEDPGTDTIGRPTTDTTVESLTDTTSEQAERKPLPEMEKEVQKGVAAETFDQASVDDTKDSTSPESADSAGTDDSTKAPPANREDIPPDPVEAPSDDVMSLPIRTTRELEPMPISRGELLVERVTLENEGSDTLDNVSLYVDGAEYDVDRIPADERITVSRGYAFFQEGHVMLPDGQVRSPDGTVHLPDRHVEVESADVIVRARLEQTGSMVNGVFEVKNRSFDPCDVSMLAIEVDPVTRDIWRTVIDDQAPIDSGETRTITCSLDAAQCAFDDSGAVRAAIAHKLGTREREQLQTLAHVVDAKEMDPMIDVTVDEGSVVAGQRQKIRVELCNVSDMPVEKFGVTASSEAIPDTFEDGLTEFEAIDPGESLYYTVEVEPDSETDTIEITIELEGRYDGEDYAERVSITGPIVRTQDRWDETVLAEWTVEEVHSGHFEWPNTLATGYRR